MWMKGILVRILAVSVVISLALPKIGDTLATWSDYESDKENYIATGSLDLRVSDQEDEPWGEGLSPCFEILGSGAGGSYYRYLSLWNAGDLNGIAYLHLKIIDDPYVLSQHVNLQIWYDSALITSGSMYDLACQQIYLGDLPGCNSRDLELILDITGGATGDRMEFDLQFELVGSWADTESSSNSVTLASEAGGTLGFWNSPSALKTYCGSSLQESYIANLFRTIVLDSAWYEDDLATGSDTEVYDNMCRILNNVGSEDYTGMVNQFRAQYLATRLNTMVDPPRLLVSMDHIISTISGAEFYFGYGSGTLTEIIATIESKASGDIFTEPPTRDEMRIMKDVCDKLNNP